MRVAILGAWHLGAVAAAVNADWGRDVMIWDRDPAVRHSLASSRARVHEPGLDELLAANHARLTVADDPMPAVHTADVVIIAYDTPVDERDELDLSPVDEAVAFVAQCDKRGILLVIHSQVPVGYGESVQRRLADHGRGDIHVTVTPENLQLGRAVDAFRNPGHLAIGGATPEALDHACDFWGPTAAELVRTDISTAEMSKHIINSMLAASTALGNELGDLARREGADATEAALLAKRDPRLRGLPIVPGLPVGGGTLARDLRLTANRLGPNSIPAAVVAASDRRIVALQDRLAVAAGNGLLVIVGLTYKPGTSATRRSIGVTLAQRLAAEGTRVNVFDPDVPLDENPLARQPGITVCPSLNSAAEGAAVIALTTAHPFLRDRSARDTLDRSGAEIHDLVGVLDTSTISWRRGRFHGPAM